MGADCHHRDRGGKRCKKKGQTKYKGYCRIHAPTSEKDDNKKEEKKSKKKKSKVVGSNNAEGGEEAQVRAALHRYVILSFVLVFVTHLFEKSLYNSI